MAIVYSWCVGGGICRPQPLPLYTIYTLSHCLSCFYVLDMAVPIAVLQRAPKKCQYVGKLEFLKCIRCRSSV
ncbi:hypothetical protein GDO81_016342 [Engystomops pustulosus]|uniref:Uncharacterized protein n=1 Tax=Engystomops pustulosus TaxID=76066 RepID=A0AAV7AVU5_ENGPU|nr:hypothetical protein GDO81_016342 [Engystomops pustulosus]